MGLGKSPEGATVIPRATILQMTVQFALESVSSLPWNHCPVSSGIRVQFGVEYAAKAIVDEIETILTDPQFDGRSIGVVTLLGTAQAAHIHELVSERISPVDVVARKIAIGPPPVFQGRERDIMMVSMVLGPGDRSAANRADIHQRFNVALTASTL